MSAYFCATSKQFTRNVDKNPNRCDKGICRQVNHAEINFYLEVQKSPSGSSLRTLREFDLTSNSDQIFTLAKFQMSFFILKATEV